MFRDDIDERLVDEGYTARIVQLVRHLLNAKCGGSPVSDLSKALNVSRSIMPYDREKVFSDSVLNILLRTIDFVEEEFYTSLINEPRYATDYLANRIRLLISPKHTIKLTRTIVLPKATIGAIKLGDFSCFSLEDTSRPYGLKVPGQTCIYPGIYKIWVQRFGSTHRKLSGRFEGLHQGVISLENTPGFEGIQFHPGTFPKHTRGCILPGRTFELSSDIYGTARLIDSRVAYRGLYEAFLDMNPEFCMVTYSQDLLFE